jgi:hypothetical protein
MSNSFTPLIERENFLSYVIRAPTTFGLPKLRPLVRAVIYHPVATAASYWHIFFYLRDSHSSGLVSGGNSHEAPKSSLKDWAATLIADRPRTDELFFKTTQVWARAPL